MGVRTASISRFKTASMVARATAHRRSIPEILRPFARAVVCAALLGLLCGEPKMAIENQVFALAVGVRSHPDAHCAQSDSASISEESWSTLSFDVPSGEPIFVHEKICFQK